jgi:hypothetical protein
MSSWAASASTTSLTSGSREAPDVADSMLDDATLRLTDALKYAQVSEDALERPRFPKSTLKVSILGCPAFSG